MDPRLDHDRRHLERAIAGALRSAIHDHGPITPEWIGSAVKRIVGQLRNVRASDVAEPADTTAERNSRADRA